MLHYICICSTRCITLNCVASAQSLSTRLMDCLLRVISNQWLKLSTISFITRQSATTSKREYEDGLRVLTIERHERLDDVHLKMTKLLRGLATTAYHVKAKRRSTSHHGTTWNDSSYRSLIFFASCITLIESKQWSPTRESHISDVQPFGFTIQ
jgi:hypothetical protein